MSGISKASTQGLDFSPVNILMHLGIYKMLRP